MSHAVNWAAIVGHGIGCETRAEGGEDQKMGCRLNLLGVSSMAAVILAGPVGCGGDHPLSTQATTKAQVERQLQSLRSEDAGVRRSAAAALGEVGRADPRAVPALAEALKDRDWNVHREAGYALAKSGPEAAGAVEALTVALGDAGANVRQAAAYALGRIGPKAEPAIPELIRLLADKHSDHSLYSAPLLEREFEGSVGGAASFALSAIGVRAVAALIKVLEGDQSASHYYAAFALGRIGAPAEPAVPALAETLREGDELTRIAASLALSQIGPAIGRARTALIGALRDENPWVRQWSAVALGHIGPEAAEAIPALKAMASGDEIPDVRSHAIEALRRIERPAGT